MLGVRFCKEGLILDPVVPEEIVGTTFSYDCYGRTYHFYYCQTDDNFLHIEDEHGPVSADTISNPYRPGGLLITKETLEKCSDTIKVYLCK